MTAAVTIDVAGGPAGGAARFRTEVYEYMKRRNREDIKVIGMRRRLSPAWLVGREAVTARKSRRVALNNVGFFTPGGERWTLLANALHFLTEAETAGLDPRRPRWSPSRPWWCAKPLNGPMSLSLRVQQWRNGSPTSSRRSRTA